MNYKGRTCVAVIGDLLDTFSHHFEFEVEYLLLDGGLMSKEVISMLDVFRSSGAVVFLEVELSRDTFFFNFYAKLLSLLLSSEFTDTTKGSETCLLYSSTRCPAFDPAEGHAIYHARFRIENTYRHSHRFKLRMASSSASYYFYLWLFGQFLECLWELFRLLVQILGASSAFARQDWVADLFVEVLSFCC